MLQPNAAMNPPLMPGALPGTMPPPPPPAFGVPMPQGSRQVVYAGFWLRVAAIFIDALILDLVLIPPLFYHFGNAAMMSMLYGGNDAKSSQINAICFVAGWLYFALMESSSLQGSFGKMALGLKVTDLHGERITFWRASGRHFATIISGFIFFIGYFMAGFTEKKQALHDMIAGTLVVRK
jgi:uncharacterized RDD family membrane protein YckC